MNNTEIKKYIKISLGAFLFAYLFFALQLLAISQAIEYMGGIIELIPKLLYMLIEGSFIIIMALFVMHFILSLIFKKINIKNGVEFYGIFFSIIVALFAGYNLANYTSYYFFPTPEMSVNKTQVTGNISESDLEKIKKLANEKNILNIMTYENFCNNKTGDFYMPRMKTDDFNDKCESGDVMMITGHISHGGGGVTYLIRKIDNEWKIIGDSEWGFLG